MAETKLHPGIPVTYEFENFIPPEEDGVIFRGASQAVADNGAGRRVHVRRREDERNPRQGQAGGVRESRTGFNFPTHYV